jgi:dsRNA-specific ribonuclease
MNTMWKNYLQEYCQKQKIALPNYRVKNQSGPSHILKFQVIKLIMNIILESIER